MLHSDCIIATCQARLLVVTVAMLLALGRLLLSATVRLLVSATVRPPHLVMVRPRLLQWRLLRPKLLATPSRSIHSMRGGR